MLDGRLPQKLFFERSKTSREDSALNEEGVLPLKPFPDMDKNAKLGKYTPISVGMFP